MRSSEHVFWGVLFCGASRCASAGELPSATLGVGRDVKVDHLVVRDCHMVNGLDTPIPFIANGGDVGDAVIKDNVFQWQRPF